jgi:hypothetical protein
MHRRIAIVWSSASRIALFQYTVFLRRSSGIHSPASGFGGYAGSAYNVYPRSIWLIVSGSVERLLSQFYFLGGSMDTDIRALLAIAQTYFDAAYEMDADKFASILHPLSSVTKVGEDGNVSVTPVEMWLAAVRNMKAPKQLGTERHDEVLSVDVVRELALLKLKLQIPPRYFTDMLSCLKVNGTWKIVQKVMTIETR